MKRVQDAGASISMNKLHEKLDGIREVLNVYNNGKKKTATHSVVTKLDNIQEKLFKLFKMKQYLLI
jgi:hypothetical protein